LHKQLGLIFQRIGDLDSKGTKYTRSQE
jgi:hypothetical protein